MLAFLFSKTGLTVAAVVAVIAILAISHWRAYEAGAAAERARMLARSVEILRERNVTDDQVRNMDSAALCRALGGRLQDDGSCI